MSLAGGSNKIQYTVSSATTEFDFPYKYWESTDLFVSVVDLATGIGTDLDYGAGDYAVNATNGDPSLGATIVTASSYDNHRVTLERIIEVESESDFETGDGIPPDALNSEFDKAAAQRQQLEDSVGRQIIHPSSDPDDLSYETPTVENRANRATGWDSEGNVTALDLSTTGTIAVDAEKGLELNDNVISAKINTDVMEFDSGDISVKNSGISTPKLANSAVTLSKITDLGALTVIGNATGSTDVPSEVDILDEDDMSSNSATSLATQQSIKEYVDSMLPNIAQSVKTSAETLTNPADWTDIGGLSVSITPSKLTSLVKVSFSLNVAIDGDDTGHVRLMRDSTPISIGDSSGNRVQCTCSWDTNDATNITNFNLVFIDTPTSTASITYKLQVRNSIDDAIYINKSSVDSDNVYYGRTSSNILVEEILV